MANLRLEGIESDRLPRVHALLGHVHTQCCIHLLQEQLNKVNTIIAYKIKRRRFGHPIGITGVPAC